MITGLKTTSSGLEVTLEKICRVGIADLSSIAEHRIVALCHSTSHFIRFHQGGCLRFAYSDKGELLELSAEAVNITIDKTSGAILVAPCP